MGNKFALVCILLEHKIYLLCCSFNMMHLVLQIKGIAVLKNILHDIAIVLPLTGFCSILIGSERPHRVVGNYTVKLERHHMGGLQRGIWGGGCIWGYGGAVKHC